MKNQVWDLVAATIEHARESGHSYAVFKIDSDYLVDFWVEWNGGLPIIGYKDLNTGVSHFDVTASQLVKVLESFE